MSKLKDAIAEMNKKYYFVGDDWHSYGFAKIDKELGDLLIEKYPDFINNGGMRIETIESFDLNQTDFDEPALTFEELWEKHLKYNDYISWDKGYRTFEEFKKGEGFE